MRNAIRKRIEEELDIPALPEAALQVQHLVNDPNATARDLATVISSDPTLTANLLRHANSGYYSFPKSVGTVPLAVVVLGFDSVREIAISSTAIDLSVKTFQQDLLNSSRFWQHSLAVAVASRIIAKKWRIALPGESFVGGLIHDLGKLILASEWPDLYKKVIATSLSEKKAIHEVENDLLGTNHAEVSGWLAEKWAFPDIIVNSVSMHHSEEVSNFPAVVQVADYLAHKGGFRQTNLDPYPKPSVDIAKIFSGFDEGAVRSQMLQDYQSTKNMLDSIGSNA